VGQHSGSPNTAGSGGSQFAANTPAKFLNSSAHLTRRTVRSCRLSSFGGRSHNSIAMASSYSLASRPQCCNRSSRFKGREPGPAHHAKGRSTPVRYAIASAIRRSTSDPCSRARAILLNVSEDMPKSTTSSPSGRRQSCL
jgi:hypothetical protein